MGDEAIDSRILVIFEMKIELNESNIPVLRYGKANIS